MKPPWSEREGALVRSRLRRRVGARPMSHGSKSAMWLARPV